MKAARLSKQLMLMTAGARSGLADGADIYPTPLADQELGGTRAKAVGLDQGPVCGVDVD
jgi:hypothetical protein